MIIKIDTKEKIKIKSSLEVFNLVSEVLKNEDDLDRDKEHCWVMGLSAGNHVKFIELISLGTLNQTLVHSREVFRRAIINAAGSIILIHNHPSGNVQPSDTDKKLTKKMMEASRILDIQLIDHLIISENEYFSFADEGMLC